MNIFVKYMVLIHVTCHDYYYYYAYHYMLCIFTISQPDEPVVSTCTTSSTIASDSTVVNIHDPTYMEARSEYLPTHQEPTVVSASNSNTV